MGDSAFYYCTGLESITLPNSIEKIGVSAFDQTHKLKKIEVVNNCVNDTTAVKEMIEQKEVEVARR